MTSRCATEPRRRRAAALLALALLASACTDAESQGDGGTASPSTSDTERAAPAPGESYAAPASHASDWAAPPADLPDAPRPYGPSPRATADPAFYDVATLDPEVIAAAEPGDVLRSEAVELTGPLAGEEGWRILYRSTTGDGDPAVVSGIVLVPSGDAPDGGRPVVAWAHGTTGIADRCAPSATGNLFYDDYAAAGRHLLDQGFVVAATDYHGLGTPGVHSYHRTDELASATVDSVVAAHRLDEAGPLTRQWAVVGHSEGGLAALALDERSHEHPDELDYRGAVVAAPTPPLDEVAPLMFLVPGRGYGVLLLAAVAGVAPDLAPAEALGADAASREALLTHGCWEEAVPGFDDIDPDQMLASPAVGERLVEVMSEWAAYEPAAARGPLLVVQGDADESVLPPFTAKLADDVCASGASAVYRTYEGAGHDAVMAAAEVDIATWLSARFAGDPPPTSCAGT